VLWPEAVAIADNTLATVCYTQKTDFADVAIASWHAIELMNWHLRQAPR